MTPSPVLTAAEAARWLRLDEDHDDIGQAVKALYLLVQQGRLRPLHVGKTYKFPVPELERFIRDEVAATDLADGCDPPVNAATPGKTRPHNSESSTPDDSETHPGTHSAAWVG